MNKYLDSIQDEDDLAEALLTLALSDEGSSIQSFYPEMIEREIFYPSAIYKHADDTIVEKLIALLSQQEDDPVSIAQLLSCIAWVGSPKVVDFFVSIEETKPEWSTELFLPACDYTLEAGWCLDGKQRRDLYLAPQDSQVIPAVVHLNTTCPVCKGSLSTLLSMHLPADSTPIAFNTCLMCSCYYPVFMKIDAEGNGSWHEKNVPEEYHELEIQRSEPIKNAYDVATEVTTTPDVSLQFPEREHSHIGGHPAWLNDPEYLKCLDCGKEMVFVAQINFSEHMAYGEGIYYLHHCDQCQVSATNFQQV